MTRPVADDHITTIYPYVPGERLEEIRQTYGVDHVVQLASNENPRGPSPKAIETVQSHIDQSHRYPDGAARMLTRALADEHGVSTDEIVPGNGSDQLLRLAIQALARPGDDRGIVSQYAFGAYPIAMQSYDIEVDTVPMQDGFGHDLEAMRAAVEPSTRLVFLANPNNPTGTHVSAEALRHFLETLPDDIVVLVDEAYHQYARAESYETALEMRDTHELLIVTRTFSKCHGLAGLRIGYAIAPPDVIDAIDRVRAPFNRNRLGERAAVAALDDEAFVEESVELNERGREQLEAGLDNLESHGVNWTPSQTNFLLMCTPFEAERIHERMLHDGVVVRPMDGYDLPRHLRITIGTAEDNARCLESLTSTLQDLEDSA